MVELLGLYFTGGLNRPSTGRGGVNLRYKILDSLSELRNKWWLWLVIKARDGRRSPCRSLSGGSVLLSFVQFTRHQRFSACDQAPSREVAAPSPCAFSTVRHVLGCSPSSVDGTQGFLPLSRMGMVQWAPSFPAWPSLVTAADSQSRSSSR